MQSDMLAKEKKDSFYFASGKAKDTRPTKIGSEVSLPRRQRFHNAGLWKNVRQSARPLLKYYYFALPPIIQSKH